MSTTWAEHKQDIVVGFNVLCFWCLFRSSRKCTCRCRTNRKKIWKLVPDPLCSQHLSSVASNVARNRRQQTHCSNQNLWRHQACNPSARLTSYSSVRIDASYLGTSNLALKVSWSAITWSPGDNSKSGYFLSQLGKSENSKLRKNPFLCARQINSS